MDTNDAGTGFINATECFSHLKRFEKDLISYLEASVTPNPDNVQLLCRSLRNVLRDRVVIQAGPNSKPSIDFPQTEAKQGQVENCHYKELSLARCLLTLQSLKHLNHRLASDEYKTSLLEPHSLPSALDPKLPPTVTLKAAHAAPHAAPHSQFHDVLVRLQVI